MAAQEIRDRSLKVLALDTRSLADTVEAGGGGGTPTPIILTEARTVLDTETGTTFFISATTGFAIILPTAALGLEFWFQVGNVVASSGNHTIVGGAGELILGNIVSTSGLATTVHAAATQVNFTGFLSDQGDYVHITSDGTNFYVDGMCKASTGITTTV